MIRRAETRDIPDVLRLLHQVLDIHHRGRPDLFRPGATKYSEQELAALFAGADTPVFVYTDDEDARVLGYAFCVRQQILGDAIRTDVPTLYIDDLCVDSACRGRGIGRALYGHVLSFARARGYYNVTLNVWSCNPEAMAFYQRMGLQPQKVGMEVIL